MAGQIRVDPEELRGNAARFNNEGKKLHDVIVAMDGLKSGLIGSWIGDAANGFAERYDRLRPGFIAAEQLIEDISQALNASANTMEEQDSKIGANWRG